MAGERNRLDELLNRDVPHAPTSAEDLSARLKRSPSGTNTALPAEQGDDSGDDDRPGGEAGTAAVREAEPVTAPEPVRPTVMAAGESKDDDVFAGLEQVIGELGEAAAGLAPAMDDSLEATGTDHTGTIEVTMAGHGRVTGFRLTRKWQAALAAEMFDSAVLEAVSDAMLARMARGLDDAEKAEPAAGRRPPGLETPFGSWVPPSGIDPDSALRQINGLLEESSRRLVELEEALARPREDVTVQSANHRVTLSVRDGMVTGVATQKSWLLKADPGRLCTEFTTAFQAVNDLADSERRDRGAPPAGGEDGAGSVLRELEDLLRSFGLPGLREMT